MEIKKFLKILLRPEENISFYQKLLDGLPDVFITFILFTDPIDFSGGIAWGLSNTKILTSGSKRVIFIIPLRGEQGAHNESIIKMLDTINCSLDSTRNYIIINSQNPFKALSPLTTVSIDITEARPWEVYYMFGSLLRLASKRKILPSKFTSGFGAPLFKQDLNLIEGSFPGRHRENALDVLSFQIQLCPCMVLQFHNFVEEIQKRFDTIFMETMESKPGALPFSEVLVARKEFEEAFNKQFGSTQKLRNESKIRQIWK